MENPVHIRSEGKSGENVVFLHGFGADRLSWLATAPALSAARTHLVDLPGHGASSPDVGDGSVDDLAKKIVNALEARIDDPAHLVAHSLGAGVAIMIAAKRPNLVKSLFLIAPAGLGQGVDQAFLSAYPNANTKQQMATVLESLVVNPRLINTQTVAYALKSLAEPNRIRGLQKIAKAMGKSETALVKASKIVSESNIPRLVLWGGKDHINPPDSKRLKAFGAFHLLPDAGHLPHIEAAGIANKYLVRFLADAR